jgi:hypothetical protein
MPLAALTPVLNDLLHKDSGSSSSSYPLQRSNSNDTLNTSDYLRKPSTVPNQLSSSSSINDVSIFIIFLLRTKANLKIIYS